MSDTQARGRAQVPRHLRKVSVSLSMSEDSKKFITEQGRQVAGGASGYINTLIAADMKRKGWQKKSPSTNESTGQ